MGDDERTKEEEVGYEETREVSPGRSRQAQLRHLSKSRRQQSRQPREELKKWEMREETVQVK